MMEHWGWKLDWRGSKDVETGSTDLWGFSLLRKEWIGTSLVVQWLRLCFHCRGTWVLSLVGELRPHRPQVGAGGSRWGKVEATEVSACVFSRTAESTAWLPLTENTVTRGSGDNSRHDGGSSRAPSSACLPFLSGRGIRPSAESEREESGV